MLEDFELDDLADTADSLSGPHAWAYGTADIFVCQACGVAFEFGADPVPPGPCAPLDLPPPREPTINGLAPSKFIARYGRGAAERVLAEAGLELPA
jgi:hypothetical protein